MLTVIMRSSDGTDTFQFSDITRQLIGCKTPLSKEEHEHVNALKKVAIPEFLEALRAIGKRAWRMDDFASNWVDQVGPGGFPMDQQGVTSDNKIRWCVTGVGPANPIYDNDFVNECYFSIENLYQTTLTLADIHQRMFELIDKHDQVAIEELLIVGGGPDQHGEGYADEASFASIAIKNLGSSLRPPKHLKRIIMDNWASQTLDVIYERESISGVNL